MEHAAEHPDMMADDHRKMLWPHYVKLNYPRQSRGLIR